MQLLTIISTIDDLNYPEKTNTYYIVNAPYIFSACWKVSLNIVDHYDYISCFTIILVFLLSGPNWTPAYILSSFRSRWLLLLFFFFQKKFIRDNLFGMARVWHLNCLQVVKPLLQERTRKKVQVLPGSGGDELLKVSWFQNVLKFGEIHEIYPRYPNLLYNTWFRYP